MTQILVMGAGYVGLAHALLFTRNQSLIVTIADIDSERIDKINNGVSPLTDVEITEALALKPRNLRAVSAKAIDFKQYDSIFLCLPTNYDEVQNHFDTSILDSVLQDIVQTLEVSIPIIIKSTLPIGYIQETIERLNYPALIFSPEFLREGQALKDNLNPSRIVFGGISEQITKVEELYLSVIESKDVPVLKMSPTEAESVKLFSNTYLAMRIAFFNELDTFSEMHGLDSSHIIKAVGLDQRIGRFYNNPSFGYGGYCLPKDSKQLRSNFEGLPADLIGAIVTSNDSRKAFIADRIVKKGVQTVGIYRLSMKHSSDNSRESAVLDIMKQLLSAGKEILIYEPQLALGTTQERITVIDDLNAFKQQSDIIIANRWHNDLSDLRDKVYTRDIFGMD
ncbi:nucleotide sugar dehydrogenase [Streptococcus pluranimalium]|uniref:UDP-glucose 6-dehydrogenase n=1 Tax=Streptococcus pluranimalium TaxID=82348 RepID=A0A345VKH0_9STRE|nr:nucleotide sugar dehydrogenase [Streptococcus pluranimalium]AXJ13222.1 UDP-glucose 6-dehydrogenase [Streptococcus pluranimalium]